MYATAKEMTQRKCTNPNIPIYQVWLMYQVSVRLLIFSNKNVFKVCLKFPVLSALSPNELSASMVLCIDIGSTSA